MHQTCRECGFDYEGRDDFEPGTSRCWKCAARAYKKGMERMKEARDGALEVLGAEQKLRQELHDALLAARDRARGEGFFHDCPHAESCLTCEDGDGDGGCCYVPVPKGG